MHLLFGTYSVYRETRVIYDYSVMAITYSCAAEDIPKNGKDSTPITFFQFQEIP